MAQDMAFQSEPDILHLLRRIADALEVQAELAQLMMKNYELDEELRDYQAMSPDDK